MWAHTNKHPTERSTQIGDGDISMSVDEAIKKICGDRPEWAVALRGLRYREGLTQKALGEMLGIEQTNISKMEQGKRPIGKAIAKRIAELFKSDYRIFL
jgi:DNA-binding XRE family transcriptional regulator